MENEMEMPCPCEDCGDWFDLNDGYPKRGTNRIICQDCHQREENNTVTIESLRKGDKFEHDGDEFEVIKRYTKRDECLLAKSIFGEQKFYYADDEVLKIN